jgi:hypothetical protein
MHDVHQLSGLLPPQKFFSKSTTKKTLNPNGMAFTERLGMNEKEW